ncbi:unnamed protein product [Brachionus calyciflorus]|uniref:Uncharacterized protein n=1 Tax=Brachionus calyciflorus TaxID=104777 RepID=A0A814EX66_9BILA|nr:unnamed protein product [Brachionus calyciflorus]
MLKKSSIIRYGSYMRTRRKHLITLGLTILFTFIFIQLFAQKIYLNLAYRNKNYKQFQIGDTSAQSEYTVVTQYFDLKKSKHTIEDYQKWNMNFFKSIGSPFVLFTDHKSLEKMLPIMKNLNLNVTILVAESHWIFFSEIERWRKRTYIEKYLNQQLLLDPEKHIHTPDLYAIWNMKSYLVYKVTELNPYNSKFYIYTDIGAWRNQIFENWPDKKMVTDLTSYLDNKILFSQISFPKLREMYIQGGFFAGSKKAIELFLNNFFEFHDRQLDSGLFIGKDQNMMYDLVFTYFNSKQYYRLRTWELLCSKDYDNWLFYQYFLANEKYYICQESKFSLLL